MLLTILESYTTRSAHGTRETECDPDLHLIDTDLGGSDGSDEDVLIKTVRVIANLCLLERAGQGIATTHAERTIKALMACLELAEKIMQHEKTADEDPTGGTGIERGEELATAALATLNNLTFYREPPDPPDPLHVYFDNICKVTCRWVVERGAGSTSSCEAVRALGNMSRATRTAQLIVLEGALDTLEPYLLHDCVTVRCAAAGVLVNVCGAGSGAGCEDAARLAANALVECASRTDVTPAPLLARALWNAHAHTYAPLDPTHSRDVTAALAHLIDDESVFTPCQASKVEDEGTTHSPIIKHHVTYEVDGSKSGGECEPTEHGGGADSAGSDLGFEEGEEECLCAPCRRLALWDELTTVAIPLMERMRPTTHDAAVGTD